MAHAIFLWDSTVPNFHVSTGPHTGCVGIRLQSGASRLRDRWAADQVTGHLQPPPGAFAVRIFSSRAKEEGVWGARQLCNHGDGHRGVGGPPSAPGRSAHLPRSSTSESLPRRSQGQSPSLVLCKGLWPQRSGGSMWKTLERTWGREDGEGRRGQRDAPRPVWSSCICGRAHLPATWGACGAAPGRVAVSSLGMAAANTAQRFSQ